MDVVVITTDADGVTHFVDETVDLALVAVAPPAPPFAVSDPIDAVHGQLFRFPAGWFGDWHPAPYRQYYVQTTGLLEVTVGDGEVRVLRPGAVVRVEDTAGRGHVTRVVGDEDVCGVFVVLPPA